MKQTARIISTNSADTFGVCSALFELGGMVIMHDASGCNSTYTTHDEPRWYDMDSMVYISALTEMEAIMGDDEKLIGDIVEAAKEQQPKFIAIAGTPIPAMTGFDYEAVAAMVEERTGIITFGFATTGMNTYISGASMALEGIAERFAERKVEKTEHLSANVLGLTPLDFSVNGSDESICEWLEEEGFEVISKWAMGSSLEQLKEAGRARVNLVVSATGLGAARKLQELFGTPYVAGVPFGTGCKNDLKTELLRAAGQTDRKDEEERRNETVQKVGEKSEIRIAVIGEGITSVSLANALERELQTGTRVICTTETDRNCLRNQDILAMDEEEICEALSGAQVVLADPLYRPICPKNAGFIELPAERFSGRIYRNRIPDLVESIDCLYTQILELIKMF